MGMHLKLSAERKAVAFIKRDGVTTKRYFIDSRSFELWATPTALTWHLLGLKNSDAIIDGYVDWLCRERLSHSWEPRYGYEEYIRWAVNGGEEPPVLSYDNLVVQHVVELRKWCREMYDEGYELVFTVG